MIEYFGGASGHGGMFARIARTLILQRKLTGAVCSPVLPL